MQKRKKKSEKKDIFEKASFLRRKRIEKGLRLEEVSEGICSVSYLSRIEKNQVIVNDEYYRALFEKLDIDYDGVKAKRNQHFYEDLLTKYLQGYLEQTHEAIIEMVAKDYYLDIEMELVVLFDNIIRGLYEDAKKGINSIELVSHSLTNEELLFFMYLISLYTFKTHQVKKTLQQIMILESIEYEQPLFALCVADITISTYFQLGYFSKGINVYYDFITKAPVHLFSRQLMIHRIEILILTKVKNFDETLKIMGEMKTNFNDDLELKENYNYYLALLNYQNNYYNEVFNITSEYPQSGRINALMASASMYDKESEKFTKAWNLINDYKFSKYEEIYSSYVQYLKMKLNNELPIKLWNYLKSILVKGYFFDNHIFVEEICDFIYLGMVCAKNKETLRIILELLKKIEYISFNHLSD